MLIMIINYYFTMLVSEITMDVANLFANCRSLFLWILWIMPHLVSHFLLPSIVWFGLFWLLEYTYNMTNIPFPTAREFEELGFDLLKCKSKGSWTSRSRRYKAFFGAEPEVVANLWRQLYESKWLHFAGVRGPKPKHLLWALLFLRRYGTEETMAVLTGVSEKTFRKWAWFYATGISKLDKIFVSCRQSLSTIDGRIVFLASANSLLIHSFYSPDRLAESAPQPSE